MRRLNYLFLAWHFVQVLSFKVTYPKPSLGDDFPTTCIFNDGSPGECVRGSECPTLHELPRDQIQSCYLRVREEYICCRMRGEPMTNSGELLSKTSDDPDAIPGEIVGRPSLKACRDYYPTRYFVVQGIETVRDEFPFMVAIGWDMASAGPNKYTYLCGGAVISYKHVLTAAHCTSTAGQDPVVVLPGGYELNDPEAKTYEITKIIVHPDYQPLVNYHDIAILEVNAEQYSLRPACLWAQRQIEGTNFTGIGYGHTQFAGRSSDKLLKAYFTEVPRSTCQTHYRADTSIPNGIVDSQLCAKDPENIRDTCQGDSGGPLVIKSYPWEQEVPFIIGVTSFGKGCAFEPPGIYTRVSAYIDWIESIVWPA